MYDVFWGSFFFFIFLFLDAFHVFCVTAYDGDGKGAVLVVRQKQKQQQDTPERISRRNIRYLGEFQQVIGDLPFTEPNVEEGQEIRDIEQHVPQGSAANWWCALACCLSGVGAYYVWRRQFLVESGQYGFTLNNGFPELYRPGRHAVMSPLSDILGVYSMGDNLICPGAGVTIARVPEGLIGLALDNGQVRLLVPGVHVRASAAFQFHALVPLTQELIELGPVKLITVRAGTERVCYNNGQVMTYREGRYAINSSTFCVGPLVSTQQQNQRFTNYTVLLDGGVSMEIQGLLTFQIINVHKLYTTLAVPLAQAIEDVTKAELARVFAVLKLEQLRV